MLSENQRNETIASLIGEYEIVAQSNGFSSHSYMLETSRTLTSQVRDKTKEGIDQHE